MADQLYSKPSSLAGWNIFGEVVWGETAGGVWLLPPQKYRILGLCCVLCHRGALCYRNPRPGGTDGHTCRPPGPEGEETHISWCTFKTPSSVRGTAGVAFSARSWRQEPQQSPIRRMATDEQSQLTSGILIKLITSLKCFLHQFWVETVIIEAATGTKFN